MPSQTKILVGILASHHRQEFVRKFREQMKDSPVDYKFFYGDWKTQPGCVPCTSESDEIFLNCDDRKIWMVQKCQGMFQYALAHGYTHVFRCCDDTVLYPDRLLKNAELLSQYDYAGVICGYGNINGIIFWLKYLDYMHGGVGIWLSAKAMKLLAEDNWKGPYSSPLPQSVEITPGQLFKDGDYSIYWDDLWIGEILKGKLPYLDPRRDLIYTNYGDIAVYDDPTLFAESYPFDKDHVISTHNPSQMGHTTLKVKPFSNRGGKICVIEVDWKTAKTDLIPVYPL